MAVVSLFVAGASAVAACSDDPKRPPASEDGRGSLSPGGAAGSREGGAGDQDAGGGVDGGRCNDIVLTSFLVDRIGLNGDPPVGTGGTIVDGTYDLTRFDVYVGVGGVGGPTGITAQSTIRVAGTTLDQVILYTGSGAPQEIRSTYSFAASGATLALTSICPAGGVSSRQFTANGTTLVVTDNVSKEVFTFTQR